MFTAGQRLSTARCLMTSPWRRVPRVSASSFKLSTGGSASGGIHTIQCPSQQISIGIFRDTVSAMSWVLRGPCEIWPPRRLLGPEITKLLRVKPKFHIRDQDVTVSIYYDVSIARKEAEVEDTFFEVLRTSNSESGSSTVRTQIQKAGYNKIHCPSSKQQRNCPLSIDR